MERTITYRQLISETQKEFEELKKVLEEEDALRHIRFNKIKEYDSFNDDTTLFMANPTLMPSEIDAIYEIEKSVHEIQYFEGILCDKYCRTRKGTHFLRNLYWLVEKCHKILEKEKCMILDKAAERYKRKQSVSEDK